MIFISTSTYFESECIINKLKLKKDLTSSKFQIFKNSDVILIITGIGKVKSAIALTHLLTMYSPKSSDIFINIGIAGCNNKNIPIGKVFICNKIVDHDTKKTYFPDLIFKHPFEETSIETYSLPNSLSDYSATLCDMEASAIYMSALTFFQSHQIFFIKIISDYLTPNSLKDITSLSNLINKNSDYIIDWILSLNDSIPIKEDILPRYIQDLIITISNNLKFSASMANEFKQFITYSYLKNPNNLTLLDKIITLKCKSKKEGKIYLEQLRKKLI